MSLHKYHGYWTSANNKSQRNCAVPYFENSETNNGWLESFKTRHSINFRFMCHESAVDMERAEDWTTKLYHVTNEYPPSNELMQMRRHCFANNYHGKARFRNRKNVKVRIYPRKD